MTINPDAPVTAAAYVPVPGGNQLTVTCKHNQPMHVNAVNVNYHPYQTTIRLLGRHATTANRSGVCEALIGDKTPLPEPIPSLIGQAKRMAETNWRRNHH